MSSHIKEKLVQAAHEAAERIGDAVAEEIRKGGTVISQEIQESTERIISVVTVAESTGKEAAQAGIAEETVIQVVPDERNIAGVGFILVALFFAVLSFWGVALVLFFIGVARFIMGPLWSWKIEVPNGFRGVSCNNGKPDKLAKQARNWNFNIFRYIPALVTARDLPIEITSAGHTGDFATIARSDLYVLRVEDPQKFVQDASLATVEKLLRAHARMIMLRVISSIKDSRVKFARGKLVNVADEINRHLVPLTGVKIHECTPTQVTNVILDDLEYVRTQIEGIRTLQNDLVTKIENAQKTVEQHRRRDEREVVNKSLELQQEYGDLVTAITQSMNATKQSIAMHARQQLDRAVSSLTAEAAVVRSKIQKAKSLLQSVDGLKLMFSIRKAKIMRLAYRHMTPREVTVIDVPGIGAGVGMSLGTDFMGRIINAAGNGDHAKAPHGTEHDDIPHLTVVREVKA
ncbi:MAG: hypothetical protein A3D65_01130 [Candidatus Lloydbacteria bacterium RIFCSPHIGHO2_02_FULL_50_13]|uniref:Band 7 domain-containing protein n=1 Tax=Candidatus Lloydbacteria bacterium RIFCSPHIGHO2_02_FULL_50_13 TaxID=1798661 RepID=A0A1G2D4E5_9BACT|nr:MAG: hypothetical protein A3D65_01130 [Candidatus Lloydbacteria bacterium RIFCSPHIGHO2_02_FULL_50_13]